MRKTELHVEVIEARNKGNIKINNKSKQVTGLSSSYHGTSLPEAELTRREEGWREL